MGNERDVGHCCPHICGYDLNCAITATAPSKLEKALRTFLLQLISLLHAFDIKLSLPKCKFFAPRARLGATFRVLVEASTIQQAWADVCPQLGCALAREWGSRIMAWELQSTSTIEFLKVAPFQTTAMTPATQKVLEGTGAVMAAATRGVLLGKVCRL